MAFCAPSARKGFTLVELMIVITIMGILLIGTYVPYRQFSIAAQVQEGAEKVAQGVATSKAAALNGYSLATASGRTTADVVALFTSGSARGWAVPHISGVIDPQKLPDVVSASGSRLWSVDLPAGLNITFSGAQDVILYWSAPYGTLTKFKDAQSTTGALDIHVSAGVQDQDGQFRKTITVK